MKTHTTRDFLTEVQERNQTTKKQKTINITNTTSPINPLAFSRNSTITEGNSRIDEEKDNQDYLNAIIQPTTNTQNIGISEIVNTNINQKKKRKASRHNKLQEYMNNIENIPYNHNRGLLHNIQKVTNRAQEYLEVLEKLTFDCKKRKIEPESTVFTPFHSPTTSITTLSTIEKEETEKTTKERENTKIPIIPPHKLKLPNTTTINTQLQYKPTSILSSYEMMPKGITKNKQIMSKTIERKHMDTGLLSEFFTTKPTVITDIDTILALAKEDKRELKPTLCKAEKHVFEETRTTSKRENTTIIQVIDSTIKNRENNEILFCIVGKNHIYNTKECNITHIYYDWKRFWDNDLNEWNTNGDFLSRWTQNKVDQPLKKSVKFLPETYKDTVLIQIESFKDIDKELPKFIEKFENKIDQGEQIKIPRVVIGVLGTRSKTKSMITKFLQKVENLDILENRFVWYKNLKQFQTKLEDLSITHVIDTRYGYLKKAVCDDKIIRKRFLIKNPKCIIEDEDLKLVSNLEEVLTEHVSLEKETKNTTKEIGTEHKQTDKISSKYPDMIEKYFSGKGNYPHDQGGIKKFITWNMNSIRNVNTKNFLAEFLLTCNADIIGITEVKGTIKDTMMIENIKQILLKAGYYFTYFNVNKNNTGQHGTAIFSRIAAKEVIKDCGGCSYSEGRLLTAIFENFIFVLTYTPTLSKPPGEQIQNKERRENYDLQLRKHLNVLKEKYKKPIILTGDMNCAIYKNHATHEYLFKGEQPSCTEEERERIKNIMIDHNLAVTYDEIHKDDDIYDEILEDNSTFYMNDSSNNNIRIGMKIDHFLTPKEWFNDGPEDQPKVLNCNILRDQQGSDHLPVSMTVRFPKTYKFPIPQQQSKKRQTAMDAYIDAFMHTPHKSKRFETNPLSYRGIHGKSNTINTIIGSEEEQEDILSELVQCKQRLDRLTDEQILSDSEFGNDKNKPININNIREEQRECTEKQVWIPHISAKYSSILIDNSKPYKSCEKTTMIDTGANHNIVGLQHLEDIVGKNLSLQKTDIFFKVGDTSKVQVLGKITLHLEIEGRDFEEEFYVMKNSNFDVLLGCDFTHKYRTKVDFNKQRLTIRKSTAKFYTKIFPKNNIPRESKKIHTFRCIEQTIVKADAITTIRTSLPRKSREKLIQGQFGAIEKSSSLLTRYGCVPSQGFYFFDNKTLNINVLNSTGRDIVIPADEEIANFVPCTVEEYTQDGLGLPISESELLNISEEKKPDYLDIPKASEIPDFTPEEITKIFEKEGLKNMLPNLQLQDMCTPEPLTQSQLDRLKQLIAKRSACWATDDSKPHHVKHYSVNIPHSNKPTVERLKPYTAEEVEHWKKYVGELQSNGTVEYSQSPWRSASFLVKKPNGGFRFVTDYRKANAQVPKMHWPLVRIESALSALGNANVISSMDANSAYHQIPLADESSKEWTSFAGPTCQLQYTTLPQGYKNSVSEYSRFTSYVLGSLVWQCCLTYLDDFLCWSPTFDQHLIDLDNILRRIEYFGIQFSAKKSLFCRKELPYLGHVIKPGKGISPNPKKVQAINDMREPKTKKELGTFLQSLSFYRRMIPLFNRMSSPLRVKYNDKKFTPLTDIELDSFRQLKKALCECPILAIPDLSPEENPFYVITDASKEGLGAILLQKGKDNKLHPISYISRMTDDKEKRRYTTYQLEMAAIIWSLQVFKPYLRYKQVPFVLRTDCQSLCWLLNSEHDAQIKKWILGITEFDFTIEYLRGVDNPSDVLSRLPLPVPEGYFREEPMDNLYCEDHGKMMKFIIECLELRVRKKQKTKTDSKTTKTNQNKLEKSLNTVETNHHNNTIIHPKSCNKCRELEQKTEEDQRCYDTLEKSKQTEQFHCHSFDAVYRRGHDSICSSCTATNIKILLTYEIHKQQRKMENMHYNLHTNCMQTKTVNTITEPEQATRRSVRIANSQVQQTQEQEEKQREEKSESEEYKTETDRQEQIKRNVIIDYTEDIEEELENPEENKQENHDAPPTPYEQMTLIQKEFNIENFCKWQKKDKKVTKILDKLQTVESTHEIHKTYKIIEGVLHINNKQLRITYNKHKNNKKIHHIRNEWSRYVPDMTLPKTELPIKWWILTQFHGLPHTGHLGHIGTYRMLRQHFYWPGIFNDVGKFIASCLPCTQRKTPKQNRYGEHKSVLQTRPFEVVSIDLVGPFEPSQDKHKFILTIIDHFTRYPIAIPIKNKDMITVARALKTHLFMAYPFWPRKIISDKGSEFVNKVIKEVYRQLRIDTILTSHDNPQSNQVERFHRYMNAAISVFISKKYLHCTWDQYVDCAVFVYRCSVNNTTGHSPFYALYGKHPVRPMDYMLNMNEEKYDNNHDYTRDIMKTFRETYKVIHKNQIEEATKNMSNNSKPAKHYDIGQKVNVWRKHDPGKLEWRYAGPAEIIEKRNDNSYIVKIGKWKTTTETHVRGEDKTKQVSVRHLKPYSPFSDEIEDTSQLLIQQEDDTDEETDEEEIKYSSDDHEMMKDTFCIVPYWAWSEIKNDLKWIVAKIIDIKVSENTETKEKQTYVTLHRYGNETDNHLIKQKPGWVEPKRGGKFKYKSNPNGNYTVAYSNHMYHKNKNNYVYSYDYDIPAKDITYYGFQLTETGLIPKSILSRIRENQWLHDENVIEQ